MRSHALAFGRSLRWLKVGGLLLVAVFFFFAPVVIILHDLQDPGLGSVAIPDFAYRWHRQLSPKMEAWARSRVASERAGSGLQTLGIAGTEWPIFTAVWFLQATENLQIDWESNPSRSAISPARSAAGAIEAAVQLVTDPAHATWVRKYWGDDYLHRENLFYRMLLISGLTSYQKLTRNVRYEPTLRDQVETLAAELDASAFGLLDDYPGQCYPIDIVPAIAVIRRSDAVLKTDHADFAARAIRGFEDTRLDPDTLLPAYFVDSRTGRALSPASGVGVSYMLIWAHELWPDRATEWYRHFERHFWQERYGVVGWRERTESSGAPDWYADVDAGPVIAGFGTAATAFGVAAARIHGRYDHARRLGAEAIVASWPLPNGRLLLPRCLSSFADAPLVGETALLFIFTRRGPPESTGESALGLPPVVFLGLGAYLTAGATLCWIAYRGWRRQRRNDRGLADPEYRRPYSRDRTPTSSR